MHGQRPLEEADELELMHTADRRLNIGCGDWPLNYYTNLDIDPSSPAEIHADALEYLEACQDGEYDEIYAGHFVEHLDQLQALQFVATCYRVLSPGGKLGLLVPDTRAIMHKYLTQQIDEVEYDGRWYHVADLDDVCALFIYSTVQDTPHKWMYDVNTLARLMQSVGFESLREIDRYRDPRLGTPAWYQCGLDGWKPEEEA